MLRECEKGSTREACQVFRPSGNRTQDSGNQSDQSVATKGVLDKLARSEEMINTLRNENHMLKNDLREAKRVLELETGEKIDNINLWLKSLIMERGGGSDRRGNSVGGGWRGRQQQISLLKSKVKSLESRLNSLSPSRFPVFFGPSENTDIAGVNQTSGATTLGIGTASGSQDLFVVPSGFTEPPFTQRHSAKEKNKMVMMLEQENEKLRKDVELFKTKYAKTKARENNLSTEVREFKKKMETLLDKGQHDDELITALADNNKQLKESVKREQEMRSKLEQDVRKETESLTSSLTQKKNEAEKLEKILFQKDDEIRELQKLLKNVQSSSTLPQESTFSSEPVNETKAVSIGKAGNTDGANTTKEITLLQVERDGLRKLVESMNERVDLLLEENCKLKNELSILENAKSSKGTAYWRLARHTRSDGLKETEPNEKSHVGQTKMSGNHSVNMDHLLNRQFLIDVLSKSALSATSANIVSKQINVLQCALSDTLKENETLKELLDKLRSLRREDFNLLSEIVRQLRAVSEDEKV
ncbi:unnamed protein product [Echinostoma caproni]|uniref:GRIP domain-containing protein n=1 Tax=Echinostoma caproni TaxID=27848 RepID=A0A183AJ61_9TREM|nr:unnamed protein product [Echinostoma caproni]